MSQDSAVPSMLVPCILHLQEISCKHEMPTYGGSADHSTTPGAWQSARSLIQTALDSSPPNRIIRHAGLVQPPFGAVPAPFSVLLRWPVSANLCLLLLEKKPVRVSWRSACARLHRTGISIPKAASPAWGLMHIVTSRGALYICCTTHEISRSGVVAKTVFPTTRLRDRPVSIHTGHGPRVASETLLGMGTTWSRSSTYGRVLAVCHPLSQKAPSRFCPTDWVAGCNDAHSQFQDQVRSTLFSITGIWNTMSAL